MTKPIAASIAVETSSDLRLGGIVRFVTTWGLLPHDASEPSVLLLAFDPADHTNLIFTMAGSAESASNPGFLLGGVVSPWLSRGGLAHCHAELYYLSKQGRYTALASVDLPMRRAPQPQS